MKRGFKYAHHYNKTEVMFGDIKIKPREMALVSRLDDPETGMSSYVFKMQRHFDVKKYWQNKKDRTGIVHIGKDRKIEKVVWDD